VSILAGELRVQLGETPAREGRNQLLQVVINVDESDRASLLCAGRLDCRFLQRFGTEAPISEEAADKVASLGFVATPDRSESVHEADTVSAWTQTA
jgi:hypothetical protein